MRPLPGGGVKSILCRRTMLVVKRGGHAVALQEGSAGLDWRKGIVGVRDSAERGSAESLREGRKRLRGLVVSP